MSAKETYKRPIIHIKFLPDELLNEVLVRHATWVEYTIDPSDLVVQMLQSSEAVKLKKEYRQSLVSFQCLCDHCHLIHVLIEI
jgi:hypothetical protein